MANARKLPAEAKNPALQPEIYFLRYAFPCAYVLLQQGKIDEKKFSRLEKAAHKGVKLERKFLEGIFINAFRRLKIVAKSMGRDYWDYAAIREYFVNRHNSMIDEGDGYYATAPKYFREFCKVVPARIIEERQGFFVVKYGSGKTRVVGSFFVPDAGVGDKVLIHHGFAVEQI